ncbi:MAG: lipocalin, partial [Boseongicola sp.]|nr:lipocalin [Boseongicola sp.]
MRRLGVYGLVLLLAACTPNTGYRDRDVEMTSMAVFDPSRYLGTWYEIARFPVSFQKGCSDVRAIYGDDGAGGLTVRNTCLRNGEMTTIDGT